MQEFIDKHSVEAEKEEIEGPPAEGAQQVDRDTTHAEKTEYNNWAMMCELNAREEYVWSNIMKLAIHQIDLLQQSGAGGGVSDAVTAGSGGGSVADASMMSPAAERKYGGKKTRKSKKTKYKKSRRKRRKRTSSLKKSKKTKKKSLHKSKKISGGDYNDFLTTKYCQNFVRFNNRMKGLAAGIELRIKGCGGNEGALVSMKQLNINYLVGPGGDWSEYAPHHYWTDANKNMMEWAKVVYHKYIEGQVVYHLASFEDEIFFNVCKYKMGFYEKINGETANFPAEDMQPHTWDITKKYLDWVEEINSAVRPDNPEHTPSTCNFKTYNNTTNLQFILTHCFCGMGRTCYMLTAVKLYFEISAHLDELKNTKQQYILDLPSFFGIDGFIPGTVLMNRRHRRLNAQSIIFGSLMGRWLLRYYNSKGYSPASEFLNILNIDSRDQYNLDLFCQRLNQLSVAILVKINKNDNIVFNGYYILKSQSNGYFKTSLLAPGANENLPDYKCTFKSVPLSPKDVNSYVMSSNIPEPEDEFNDLIAALTPAAEAAPTEGGPQAEAQAEAQEEDGGRSPKRQRTGAPAAYSETEEDGGNVGRSSTKRQRTGAPAAYSEPEEDAAIMKISTIMAGRSAADQDLIAAATHQAVAEVAAEKDAMDHDAASPPGAAAGGLAITWSDLKDIMGKIWNLLKQTIN